MLDVLIRLLAHILTPLFLFGMVGSVVVVAVTLVKDIRYFSKPDEPTSRGH